MKTTIENKAEPVAPVTWPALFRYTKESDCNGEVALWSEDGSAVTLVSTNKDYPVGFKYPAMSNRFTDSGNFHSSWTRLTTPITITFDPTK